MARNAIESYLRTSKMAASGHFIKNLKKYLELTIDIVVPKQKSCVWYRSEMARNAIESYLLTSKMAARRPFYQKLKKKKYLRRVR